MITTKRIRVADLRNGDFLSASKIQIAGDPWDSVVCPAGKIHVPVRYANGQEVTVTWGKNTKVKIVSGYDNA